MYHLQGRCTVVTRCATANPSASQEAQCVPAAFIQLLECISTPIFLPEGPVVYSKPKTALHGRARLTLEQAMNIFKIKRTTTGCTATLSSRQPLLSRSLHRNETLRSKYFLGSSVRFRRILRTQIHMDLSYINPLSRVLN